MKALQFPLTLAVLLAATFYAAHRGWEGFTAAGAVCSLLWFLSGGNDE